MIEENFCTILNSFLSIILNTQSNLSTMPSVALCWSSFFISLPLYQALQLQSQGFTLLHATFSYLLFNILIGLDVFHNICAYYSQHLRTLSFSGTNIMRILKMFALWYIFTFLAISTRRYDAYLFYLTFSSMLVSSLY